MAVNLTGASFAGMSDLLIFVAIFSMVFSGWVIGTVLIAELRSQSGIAHPQSIHIWFADNLGMDGSGLPRRLRSALKREFAELPCRLPVRAECLRRRFPADPEAWTRLLANAPETITALLPPGRPGVLIWAECTKGTDTAHLHFLPSPELAERFDCGMFGLGSLEDVPLSLRPGLAPTIAAMALAHLSPVLQEAGFRRETFLTISAKKLTLHIDELRGQCAGHLGSAASYVYAWLRFRLALDGGQRCDLNAVYRNLNAEIANWPDDRPRSEYAQISSSLSKLCYDWGMQHQLPDALERSAFAAEKAIKLLSEESASIEMAVALHAQAEALLALGEMGRDPGPLIKALRDLRSAAQIYRSEDRPARWARLRHDMGKVHAALARIRGGTKDLEDAIAAFNDALSHAGKKCGVAKARSRRWLGVVYLEIGRREGKPDHFKRAARELETAYDELSAFGEFEAANAAQVAHGMALMYFGRHAGDPRPLRRAAESLRLVPLTGNEGGGEGDDRRLLPGRVHRLLGTVEGSLPPLRESVRELSAVARADGFVERGELRAAADFERGLALAELGRVSSSAETYAEAAAAFRGALQGIDRGASPWRWALAQLRLARVLMQMAGSEGGFGNGAAGEAANAYRKALCVFNRAEMPHVWLAIQDELGTALRLSGARQGGTPDLEGAVGAWRKALNGAQPGARQLRNRAMMLNDLGNTLCDLAYAENDAGRLREARSAYLEAFDLALANGEEALEEIVRSNLGLTETAVSSRMRLV